MNLTVLRKKNFFMLLAKIAARLVKGSKKDIHPSCFERERETREWRRGLKMGSHTHNRMNDEKPIYLFLLILYLGCDIFSYFLPFFLIVFHAVVSACWLICALVCFLSSLFCGIFFSSFLSPPQTKCFLSLLFFLEAQFSTPRNVYFCGALSTLSPLLFCHHLLIHNK